MRAKDREEKIERGWGGHLSHFSTKVMKLTPLEFLLLLKAYNSCVSLS